MQFDALGLKSSLLETVKGQGYSTPTPIQAAAIPAILSGKDVLAAAQTGTGKTAGFTLPLLQLLSASKTQNNPKQVRALVLTPTRELAAQVEKNIYTYGKNEALSTAVVFGGVNVSPQRRALSGGVDILVATPGRLLDLFQQKAVKFDEVEILVLDEADRMLDMGFIHDIKRIQKLLPQKRQNLMFSATFTDPIRALAKGICQQPVEIDVAPRNSTIDAITQVLYQVPKDKKANFLAAYLSETVGQVLVFSRTKSGANKLGKRLNKVNIHAAAFHGNKSQNQRIKALEDFKQGKVQVLVATDIAARGIDILKLPLVINYDLPQVAEDYIHRIGRTGRAGANGIAVSIVSPDETKQLKGIERLLKTKIPRAEDEAAIFTRINNMPELLVAEVTENTRPKNFSGSKYRGKPANNKFAKPKGRNRGSENQERKSEVSQKGRKHSSGRKFFQGSMKKAG